MLVRKPRGKRTPGRPRCMWDDNIKTDLRQTLCEVMEYIQLLQDKGLVNVAMNLQVP